jgi:poly(A) polymerase
VRYADHPGRPVIEDLGRHYQERGYRLALTGGATRDFLLGRSPRDLDLTSDASPDDTEKLLTAWAGNATRSRNRFGVVTTAVDGLKLQVLTFHTPRDWYPDFDPALLHEDPLLNQLLCADVTINTATVLLPEGRWIDPFGAAADARARLLRPPIDPYVTIAGNPHTIVRYARFAAELGFRVAPEVLDAMTALAGTIRTDLDWGVIVSLTKILMAPDPAAGIAVLRDTGVLDHLPATWRAKLDELSPTGSESP